MNNNIKKEFIDRQVKAFTKGGDLGGLIGRHKKIVELALKYASKDDHILDVGCFDGRILKALGKEGYQNLYGVDFSETSKKSFVKSSIHFASCDIENEEIPFRKKFDIVIFSDVLPCVFSPQTVLFDIKKRLSENAKIILSVPNAGWFLNGFLLSFFPSKLFLSTTFGPWGITSYFTFYHLRKISQNLRFKIIELTGAKIDNYAFKKGVKKILFDFFVLVTYPLVLLYPQLFSAHIFGVFQNTQARLTNDKRFELGEAETR